ncbi:MAG: hypothetical protein V3U29_00580, partial [Phycisphaeraceae bacterium]
VSATGFGGRKRIVKGKFGDVREVDHEGLCAGLAGSVPKVRFDFRRIRSGVHPCLGYRQVV